MQSINFEITRIKERLKTALHSEAKEGYQGLTQDELDFLKGFETGIDLLEKGYSIFLQARDCLYRLLQAVDKCFRSILESPPIDSTRTDHMMRQFSDLNNILMKLPKEDNSRAQSEDIIKIVEDLIESERQLEPYLQNRDLLVKGYAILIIAVEELQGLAGWLDSVQKPDIQRKFQFAQIKEKLKSWLNEFKSGAIVPPKKTGFSDIVLLITKLLDQVSLINPLKKTVDLWIEVTNKQHFSKETLEALRSVDERCKDLIVLYSGAIKIFARCFDRIAAIEKLEST